MSRPNRQRPYHYTHVDQVWRRDIPMIGDADPREHVCTVQGPIRERPEKARKISEALDRQHFYETEVA